MFFKKMDFLSPKITLWRNGELCHSSAFSGILTLFVYTSVIIIGIILSLDFFQKRNPSAFYFNGFVENAGFFPLNSSSMFHYIQIMNSETSSLEPIDYNSIRIIGLKQVINLYAESNKNLSNIEHWIYGPCKDNDIIGIESLIQDDIFKISAWVRKYYNKEEHKYYNTNEKGFIWPSIDKGCSNLNRTFYGVVIEQCRNDSVNQNCKSLNEIKKYFLSHSIEFRLINQYVDVYDYKTPLKKQFIYSANGFFDGSYTPNHFNFNPLTVITRTGFIFGHKKVELSYLFDQNEKITTNWDKIDTDIYVAFYFWMQNQMQYYERSYKKLINVLADIGGFGNSILVIATFINKLVNNYINILDSQDLIIDIDKNLANSYYNNKKIIKFSRFRKSQDDSIIYHKKNEENDDKKFSNILSRNIDNNLEKNIINNNERSYNQSTGAKNLLSANNLLYNDNLLINVMNKKRRLTQYNRDTNHKDKNLISGGYKYFEKISFNFLDYLLYLLCDKSNKILRCEDFRQKIISEEQIIQSYIKLFQLLNAFGDNNDIRKYGNIDIPLIMNSFNQYNIKILESSKNNIN